MNSKEIGAFLKQLRKEKRITQEQLAEILGVSGRTVSRWETGTNLPDLSILVQISEYYNVEIGEILNGERKAAKAGSISFSIMFLVCAVTIVVQMLMDGSFPMIIGETAALFAGGLVYIFFIVKNGAWNGAMPKGTPKKDLVISLVCVGVFSIVFYLIIQKNVTALQAVGLSVCFFTVLSALSYALLRGLSCLSKRNSDK